MASPELPCDAWHDHIYLMFDGTRCDQCGKEPDLAWAWDELGGGEAAGARYALGAVPHWKDRGWRLQKGRLYCPRCASRPWATPWSRFVRYRIAIPEEKPPAEFRPFEDKPSGISFHLDVRQR